MSAPSNPARSLFWVKLLHTAVWLFFVLCIVAIPVAVAENWFLSAAILSGLTLIECAILAVNRCRCPLTGLAARYTSDRAENFDIWLPLWLARWNKTIFGLIFVLAELFALGRWFALHR